MRRSADVLVLLLACILGTGYSAHAAPGPVLINEFMAANSNVLADPQGQFDDWVELHNAGDALIDTAGMYLTDDPKVPTKWKIPTGAASLTRIAAKGHLLIWLDSNTADSGLHASFGLDAAGDEIALFDKDGSTLLDTVAFKSQRGNISYGRFPSGADAWGFMTLPTPGTLNATPYDGLVADTKFSRDRGYCDGPFDVTITCNTPGTTIFYTLDGSEPGSPTGRLPEGQVYSGPIRITKTTCLRAQALKEGWLPSDIDTQTYLFLDGVIQQTLQAALAVGYPSSWSGYGADYEMDPEICNSPEYRDQMVDALSALPVLSLVTDRSNLFGPSGIYSNPGSEGPAWEKPVSAEFFTPDGSKEFHVNCGLRIQGGASRQAMKCPKHSLSLRFGSAYGPSRLEYDLFDGSPVNSFNSLQLRGGFNNAWTHWAPDQRQRAQYLRDQWARDSLLDMGQADAGYGLHAHVYINGMYWGVYNVHERVDASHYVDYNGGDPERIDTTNGDPTYKGSEPGQMTNGTIDAWLELQRAVSSRNWGDICKVLDVDNFIDWAILNYYAGATDLKRGNNWRSAGGGPDRRPWRIYSWDAEKILENLQQNGIGSNADPTSFFGPLSNIEEYRIRFGDRVHKHLFNGGALTVDRNIARWTQRSDDMETAIIAESARWGDYRRDVHPYQNGPYDLYTRNEYWIPEKDRLLNDYFPHRASIALSQFRSRGLYPNIDAPVFHIGGTYQHGGRVAAGASLSMQGGTGTIWYTLDGSDPRVPGVEASTGGNVTTLVAENVAKRVLVPAGPVNNAWRGGAAFDDSAWIAGAGGVGYERSTGYEPHFTIDVLQQMYAKQTSCCVRIPFTLDKDPATLDTVQLRVRYDDGFVAYLNGVEVARRNVAGEPVWNSAASAQHYDIDAINLEDISLPNARTHLKTGQNILAIQAMNDSASSSDFLLSVMLVSSAGAAGSPAGVSANAIRYASPITLDQSTAVKARALNGSTWSALNEAVYTVGSVTESLRISEILYHPAEDPNAEYIELTNVGSQPINLNLVRFTRGIEYTFPSFELPPAGYCLLVKDVAAFEAAYGNQLPVLGQYTGSLSNSGERIELVDAAGGIIQSFEYQDNWFDLTDGLGFSLTALDPKIVANQNDKTAWRPSAQAGGSPGTDDDGQVPALGSVVINELMANPSAGGSDWIELYNTTGQAIGLSGWFLSDNNDDLTRYRIAEGTSIPAGGYVVFYQDLHFGNPDDPGCKEPFGLSKDGETLYLHSGSAGVLTGYSEQGKFEASEPGVSLGRRQESPGSSRFAALTEPTPGQANAAPVISNN